MALNNTVKQKEDQESVSLPHLGPTATKNWLC